MKKRNNLKFGILLLAFLLPAVMFAQNSEKVTKVVIDAGHGGTDLGAVNNTYDYKEKDINLAVALATGELIKKNLPDVEVIYTRDKDVFLELSKRAQIANDAKADVFISIHCQAANSNTASGVETWVLGESKSSANLDVLKRENDVIKLEANSSQYDDFMNSPEAAIMLSLYQREYLNQSLKLAQNVQTQLLKRKGSNDRGVKMGGFLVLWKTAMPSVIVELGFITNDEEGRYMASEAGQQEMANAIYQAFSDFKKEYEK